MISDSFSRLDAIKNEAKHKIRAVSKRFIFYGAVNVFQ